MNVVESRFYEYFCFPWFIAVQDIILKFSDLRICGKIYDIFRVCIAWSKDDIYWNLFTGEPARKRYIYNILIPEHDADSLSFDLDVQGDRRLYVMEHINGLYDTPACLMDSDITDVVYARNIRCGT